ncbi:SH3 domain-containing protein [Priestia megaterium]
MFIAISFVCTFIFGFYIDYRLKRNTTHFPVINSIEKALQTLLKTSVYSYEMFTDRFHKKKIQKWTKKRNLIVAIGLIALLTISFNKWPNASSTVAVVQAERWLVESELEQKYIETAKAQELVGGWVGELRENTIGTASSEPEIFYLKDGIEGGKVRAEPSKSGAVLDVVSPDESITYLGEKQENGEITWMKVQTENDQTGWISSRIIE